VEGAVNELKFQKALYNTEFEKFSMNMENIEKVLFFDFENDVRKERGKTGDLYELIAQFKEKVSYPEGFLPQRDLVYQQITESKNHEQTVSYIKNMVNYYPELADDKIINDYLKTEMDSERENIIGNIMPPPSKLDALSLASYMADLREIKTNEEIDLLRKAVAISCIAQNEVMKAIHPNMSETEVYGIHEYVFKKYGAMFEGYPGIVGVGNNGCVLHYIQNDKQQLGEELILMDLGAEYYGYTADVTRTIPVNGKFTKEQKAIYNLVLEAQEQAFKACKPGNKIRITTEISREVIATGLVDLGLIKDKSEVSKYFPHGVSHHIGLDVHDPGNYELFEENMTLTVEPGIYIPIGSECDKKWWGIGVRIEDDILITKNGYELLSNKAPRTVKEIEALMRQSSPLSDLKLPDLD
jgi:Xaa-Pro aminopeptidase